MMLGTITLSDHLILDGLESAQAAVVTVKRLIGGTPVVQTDGNGGGRQLELVGENHFTLGQLKAIQTLMAARQPVTMTHHRGTFTVLVVAIDPGAAFPYADPTDDDWYSATIYLQEI